MHPQTNQADVATIRYKDEVIRKLIHLCSLSIPIVYYFISRSDAIVILGFMTGVALILDIGRYYSKSFAKVFYSVFGFLLRKHELDHSKRNLNGATYVLISALLCVLIFPKVFFITAFSVLIISDSIAALIGRKFGKNKFLFKSLEGTFAFFVSASIVVLFTPKIEANLTEYLIGIFAVAVGAIIENVSFGLADDNLSIPLSIGFTMWLGYYLFLPELNLVLQNVPS